MDLDEEYILLLSLLYCRLKRKRKKRRIWMKLIEKDRPSKSAFYTLFHEVQQDERKFYDFVRMSKECFDELLNILRPKLKKTDTFMRDSIPAEERLVIALRYLAIGCSITDLHNTFRVGKSTASVIIRQVCQAIIECVAPLSMPNMSVEKWVEISADFEKNANFPHCIGAIGGKHIRITPNNRTKSYRYRGYSSLALLAICDVNYMFTYIDIGNYGKSNDCRIFRNSKSYENFSKSRETLQIPPPSAIGHSNIKYPYVAVGNKAFSLCNNLMRPYSGRNLTDKKKTFNHRLGLAENYIERCFGIFTDKWQIFQRPLNVDGNNAESLIQAACVLHNFVLQRDGLQRYNTIPACRLGLLRDDVVGRTNQRAMLSRHKFTEYFVDTFASADSNEIN